MRRAGRGVSVDCEASGTAPRIVWPPVSTDSAVPAGRDRPAGTESTAPPATAPPAARAPAALPGPVPLRRLDPGLPVPRRAHPGDAGVDLCAASDLRLGPGERALVGTGIAVALPVGTVGLVHPRSGLAARTGLSIVNTPGTIDAGYRGEIKVCLINHDRRAAIDIARGDRIAQLVVQRVELVDFVEVDELDETARGDGGYGSSGGHSALGGGRTARGDEAAGESTERGE